MNPLYHLDIQEGVHFRVKRGHWLPRRLGVDCVAFGRVLYLQRPDAPIPRHEFLHLVQFRTYGIPRVVCHYLFHAAQNYRQCRNLAKAFRDIPFEREARAFEEEDHRAAGGSEGCRNRPMESQADTCPRLDPAGAGHPAPAKHAKRPSEKV